MKELKSLNNMLKLQASLSLCIRYADNATLLSAIFDKLQLSTSQLVNTCHKCGMKINGADSKIMKKSFKKSVWMSIYKLYSNMNVNELNIPLFCIFETNDYVKHTGILFYLMLMQR